MTYKNTSIKRIVIFFIQLVIVLVTITSVEYFLYYSLSDSASYQGFMTRAAFTVLFAGRMLVIFVGTPFLLYRVLRSAVTPIRIELNSGFLEAFITFGLRSRVVSYADIDRIELKDSGRDHTRAVFHQAGNRTFSIVIDSTDLKSFKKDFEKNEVTINWA